MMKSKTSTQCTRHRNWWRVTWKSSCTLRSTNYTSSQMGVPPSTNHTIVLEIFCVVFSTMGSKFREVTLRPHMPKVNRMLLEITSKRRWVRQCWEKQWSGMPRTWPTSLLRTFPLHQHLHLLHKPKPWDLLRGLLLCAYRRWRRCGEMKARKNF